MSVSVFDHPLLAGLLSDDRIAAAFHTDSEIGAMLRFEAALAQAEETVGMVPPGSGAAIAKACATFVPDLDALRTATARDGVCVPELVRQLRLAVGEPHGAHVHLGATSQDVVDTALILRLKPVFEEMGLRIAGLLGDLDRLSERFGSRPLMAHTRMQRALPIRCLDRIATWRKPLARLQTDLQSSERVCLRLQLGGAVGTLHAFGDHAEAVAGEMADTLGVAWDGCWHTDRSGMAAFAGWLSRMAGALGKIGQDIALMAQNERSEIRLSGGGISSAMPHKQNPVAAEVLVSMARFNATLLSGMHQAQVHENERSGAAWTLEWMLLPQMTVATGAALSNARRLFAAVDDMGERDNG